jgi:hypothetical protein
MRAPQHQQFADVLDGRGIQLIGQGLQHGLASLAVVAEDAHLDQPVGFERGIDFLLTAGSGRRRQS